MTAIQQLINVIDAGNIDVPENSQLLRVLKQATSDSICIESRAALDLPFERLCLYVSVCSGSCTPATAGPTVELAVEPTDGVANPPVEEKPRKRA